MKLTDEQKQAVRDAVDETLDRLVMYWDLTAEGHDLAVGKITPGDPVHAAVVEAVIERLESI